MEKIYKRCEDCVSVCADTVTGTLCEHKFVKAGVATTCSNRICLASADEIFRRGASATSPDTSSDNERSPQSVRGNLGVLGKIVLALFC